MEINSWLPSKGIMLMNIYIKSITSTVGSSHASVTGRPVSCPVSSCNMECTKSCRIGSHVP